MQKIIQAFETSVNEREHLWLEWYLRYIYPILPSAFQLELLDSSQNEVKCNERSSSYKGIFVFHKKRADVASLYLRQ